MLISQAPSSASRPALLQGGGLVRRAAGGRGLGKFSAQAAGRGLGKLRAQAPAAVAASQNPLAGILFDMDGTLINSEHLSCEVAVDALREAYGLSVKADDFKAFTGMGEASFLGGVARLNMAPEEVDVALLKETFFRLYLARAAQGGSNIAYPGARELVLSCRRAGLKTAIASSADRLKVDANLKLAGFAEDDFDAIVSADDVEQLKPSPDIFLLAAKRVGVPPSQCAVLEDAVAGVQAARAAGMRVLGVLTSVSAEDFREKRQEPDAVRPQIGEVTLEDLQGLVSLPGVRESPAVQGAESTEGTVSRRGLLQYSSLGAGLVCFYILATQSKGGRALVKAAHLPELLQLALLAYVLAALPYWTQTLSFLSPKAVTRLLLPQDQPLINSSEPSRERVAAFKQFIASREARGAGEQVPDFPKGLAWLNSTPLSLARELKGKVVVLDFWTYCCINCMHILPDLAALEEEFEGTAFAVVGVHSAKFDNEKDTEAIRSAVLRNEISHPCVNDGDMVLWHALGVSSWPTLAVVSPYGKLLLLLTGEGHGHDLADIVQAGLEYYGERGELDASPLPLSLERNKEPRLAASPLRFPGKLAVDCAGGRLFIADTNNNRVVVTDLQGGFLQQIGGNGAGLKDGGFEDAGFQRPQGLAFSPKHQKLYVADTENHCVRELDLVKGTVQTIAGTGQQGGDLRGGAVATRQALSSPFDLALSADEEALFIACSGQHQIWRHHLASGVTAAYSGDGTERNRNGGPGEGTSWAQPSGLSLSADGQSLFVADSESSAVREVLLKTGRSRGHVGGDALFPENLFRYGDVDGRGRSALLQHPLAVACLPDGHVLVADSFNHRLKVLDPSKDGIVSVAGSGVAGFADGRGHAAQLSEPGGLAVGNGVVYVADTNNCVVRVFNLDSQQLSTLQLFGVPPPRVPPDTRMSRSPDSLEGDVSPGALLVRAADSLPLTGGAVRLSVALPPGFHLTPNAGSAVKAQVVGPLRDLLQLQPGGAAFSEKGGTVSAELRVTSHGQPSARGEEGGSALRLEAKVYYCKVDSVCLYQQFVVVLDIASGGGKGRGDVSIELRVPPPR